VRRPRGAEVVTRQSVVVKIQELMQAPGAMLKRADPCTMVIFGAGGDLTKRKLIPALFHLKMSGFLPDDFRVVGCARESFDDASFRAAMRKVIDEFGPKPLDKKLWERFEASLYYMTGDLADPETYKKLNERLVSLERGHAADHCGRLVYLAIPPS